MRGGILGGSQIRPFVGGFARRAQRAGRRAYTEAHADLVPCDDGQLDEAIAADAKGDLKNARLLAIELRKKMPDAPELDLYISTLQVRDGKIQ